MAQKLVTFEWIWTACRPLFCVILPNLVDLGLACSYVKFNVEVIDRYSLRHKCRGVPWLSIYVKIRFRAGICPRSRGPRCRESSHAPRDPDPLVGWGGDTPPHTTPTRQSAPTHLRHSPIAMRYFCLSETWCHPMYRLPTIGNSAYGTG